MSVRRRIRGPSGGSGGGVQIIRVEVPVDSSEINENKWRLDVKTAVRAKELFVGLATRVVDGFRTSVFDSLVVIAWVFEPARLMATETVYAIARAMETFRSAAADALGLNTVEELRADASERLITNIHEEARPDESVTITATVVQPESYSARVTDSPSILTTENKVVGEVNGLLINTAINPGISGNANPVSTGFTLASSARDGNLGSNAQAQATSSGVGNGTSNTNNHDLQITFADYKTAMLYITNITRAELFVRYSYVRSGSAVLTTGPYPTRNLNLQHNLSGSFATWYNTTATGVFGSADVTVPQTTVSVDVTSIVNDDWQLIDNLTMRAVGSHSSGAGTVSATTLTLGIHEMWLELEAERLDF